MNMNGISPTLRDDPVRRERWAALTEGLADDLRGISKSDPASVTAKRNIIEALLDNQLRAVGAHEGEPEMVDYAHLPALHESLKKSLTETAYAGTGTSMGWDAQGTAPSNAKVFTTQSLGMVRRVFPKMIATDLIGTQPMSQPTAKVFYKDTYFSHTNGTIAANERVDDSSAWTVADMRDYASEDTSDASVAVEGSTAREIKLNISSVDVVAETKKLAAEWPQETQQDLRVYHGISAEDELMNDAADEISREIDRQLINFIYTTALNSGAGIAYWAKGGYTGAVPSEQKAWDETLFDAIEDAAVLIENKRYRLPQWLVMNATTAGRFRKLSGFHAAVKDNEMMTVSDGARRIFGTMNERWTIYVDPWFQDDTIIVGYKGTSFLEAGIVYCPYIPWWRTPLFTNPKTFLNQRGIMSRFGKVAVVPEMYALVVLTDT